tara:strand:- start:501 stop:698 length:198 start_codon:yes stop_codon:yes gene_type:complete
MGISNMDVMVTSLRDTIIASTQLTVEVTDLRKDITKLSKEVKEAHTRLDRIDYTLQTAGIVKGDK